MIKLVIFDIGNVILRFDHHITCNRLEKYSPYSQKEIYGMVFEDSILATYEKGKISSVDFFKIVKKRLSLDLGYEKFYTIWADIFSEMEGMKELILALKGKAKLYILSNTDEIHFGYLKRKYAIFKNFDQYILSFEAGARKPEKKIYRLVLESAGTHPSSSLFIDDIEDYILPFTRMGGNGHVFKGADDLRKRLKKHGLL